MSNALKFRYLSRPSSASMIRALHLLYALGAIDVVGALTRPLGFQTAELPLSPMHAKVLLVSSNLECSSKIGIIVAAGISNGQPALQQPPQQQLAYNQPQSSPAQQQQMAGPYAQATNGISQYGQPNIQRNGQQQGQQPQDQQWMNQQPMQTKASLQRP